MASSPIPDELIRNGRSANQNFAQTEQFFFRFHKLDAGKVPIQSIRCPDQSTNRSQYCLNHEWVLLPNYQGWGVAALMFRDLPAAMTTSGKVRFEFGAVHDPQENNYSHTELSVIKNSIRVRSQSKINDQIRLEYRMAIANRLLLLKNPS